MKTPLQTIDKIEISRCFWCVQWVFRVWKAT